MKKTIKFQIESEKESMGTEILEMALKQQEEYKRMDDEYMNRNHIPDDENYHIVNINTLKNVKLVTKKSNDKYIYEFSSIEDYEEGEDCLDDMKLDLWELIIKSARLYNFSVQDKCGLQIEKSKNYIHYLGKLERFESFKD